MEFCRKLKQHYIIIHSIHFCFSRFPSNENQQQEWLGRIGRPGWKPLVSSVICSLHFDLNDLIELKNKRILKPKAVPFITASSFPNVRTKLKTFLTCFLFSIKNNSTVL